MADEDVTTTNCTGETCGHIVGTDPTAVGDDVGKLLVVGKYDGRTFDCDGGQEHVKICNEATTIPFPAGSSDECGNTLRIQETALGADCGLVVLAPLIVTSTNGSRVTIPQNVDGADPDGVIGSVSKTLSISNPDACPRLATIFARMSAIVEIGASGAGPIEMQVAYRTEITGGLFTDGLATHERVATLTYTAGSFVGRTLNDLRDITDLVIIPAGGTVTLEYRPRTIRNVATHATPPDRGMLAHGFTIRSEQVRES